MATLSTWECGSRLYGPQKLELYIYPTGFEHEIAKARPGKANVIANVLSHKAHYNYLVVVHLTREEPSTQLLPDL
jgi:hypothetical protein